MSILHFLHTSYTIVHCDLNVNLNIFNVNNLIMNRSLIIIVTDEFVFASQLCLMQCSILHHMNCLSW